MKTEVEVDSIDGSHKSEESENACHSPKNKWFRKASGTVRARRLFAFPCAGGSARMFRGWQDWLPEMEVVAVELPGRGIHRCRPPVEQMSDLIDELATALDSLPDAPFAIFGHSMGALVAFELSRALARSGRRTPDHLFVSGMRAPHLIDGESRVHTLPEAEFLAAVESLRGIPAEVIQHQSLVRHFLPILRADLRLAETYRCPGVAQLPHAITVFAGLDDPTTPTANLDEWSFHTRCGCDLRLLEGNHFFIHQHAHVMAASIARSLATSPAEQDGSPVELRSLGRREISPDPLMDRRPATHAPSAVADASR